MAPADESRDHGVNHSGVITGETTIMSSIKTLVSQFNSH